MDPEEPLSKEAEAAVLVLGQIAHSVCARHLRTRSSHVLEPTEIQILIWVAERITPGDLDHILKQPDPSKDKAPRQHVHNMLSAVTTLHRARPSPA